VLNGREGREVGRLELALKKLRVLGLTPYEAWKCVEHFRCPRGVDYVEVFEALADYLEAIAEQGLPDPEEEWERRYMEEVRAEEKRKVVVSA